jgi:hypothetical protein
VDRFHLQKISEALFPPPLPTPGNPLDEQSAKGINTPLTFSKKGRYLGPSVSTQTEEDTESVGHPARPSIAQWLSRHLLQQQPRET